jgi:hypothetical protein
MENPSPSILAQDAIKELFQERYIYFIGTYETLNDFGRSNNKANIQLSQDMKEHHKIVISAGGIIQIKYSKSNT